MDGKLSAEYREAYSRLDAMVPDFIANNSDLLTVDSYVAALEAELVEKRHTFKNRLTTAQKRYDKAEADKQTVGHAIRAFVKYADEYPEDISGPLRDDFLPLLRKALSRIEEK
jgi:hypothetical protein